jgi:hypothetical protein
LDPILQAHPFNALPGGVLFTSAGVAFNDLRQLIADGVGQTIVPLPREIVQGLIVDELGYFETTRHAQRIGTCTAGIEPLNSDPG